MKIRKRKRQICRTVQIAPHTSVPTPTVDTATMTFVPEGGQLPLGATQSSDPVYGWRYVGSTH